MAELCDGPSMGCSLFDRACHIADSRMGDAMTSSERRSNITISTVSPLFQEPFHYSYLQLASFKDKTRASFALALVFENLIVHLRAEPVGVQAR
jgi:hypothetical protein